MIYYRYGIQASRQLLVVLPALESNRDVVGSMKHNAAHRLQWVIVHHLDMLKAFQHDLESDPGFQACQRCAQTEVYPMTEGDVTVRRAPYIKEIGLGKSLLVAVG